MNTTKKRYESPLKKPVPAKWPRIGLLIILACEALGSLSGGLLLIAGPDGRYMEMPVTMLHGHFTDFRIPGLILAGLGLLNMIALITVFRKAHFNWLIPSIALGGMFIWFTVEIMMLQELHWLHLIWGAPVFIGIVLLMRLLATNTHPVFLSTLLISGILSSLWYLFMNIIVPLQYEGYSIASYTVSELSAIGAPTRILWVLLAMIYPVLFCAFGWGVWSSGSGNHFQRIAGILIVIYSILNLYWPPMHRREVIAAGGGTLTDTLHIAWAMITILLMTAIMAFGAAASGIKFRIYTFTTWLIFIVFGILTWRESPGIEANQPTPWIGIWERINIAAFMLWIISLGVMLIRRPKPYQTQRLENSYPG